MNNMEMEEKEEVVAPEVVDTENVPVSEAERKKLDEYEQQVSARKSKKKKIWNVVFFIFNIALVVGIVLWQVFTTEDFKSLGELNINIWWFLVLFVIVVIVVVSDVLPVSYLVRKACKRSRFRLSFKTTIIGRYYDAVTPLSTGGQAFQVTYLIAHDVPSTVSLSIPIAKLFFTQLTWFIVSAACLIASFSNPNMNTFVSIASYIGFALNFLILAVNFFLAVGKNTGKKIVVKVLKLLQKMKIVKNYEKQYKRTTEYIEDYQNIMIRYMKSPKDFLYMFLTIGLREFIEYTIPFFVYLCFGCPSGYHSGMFAEFFTMVVLIEIASSFIPLPGGTGMTEISFNAMFAMYFGGSVVWGMLIYRFFIYYLYLILGLIVISYDFSYGKRKYRWVKKQRALQAESLEFKQIQIQNFRTERESRRKKQVKKSV